MNAVVTTRYREDKRTLDVWQSYWKGGTWYYESNPVAPDLSVLNLCPVNWSPDGVYVARAMHDNVTPHFTARRNAGEVIMNDKQRTKKTVVYDVPTEFLCRRDFGWYEKYMAGKFAMHQAWGFDPFPSLPDITSTEYDTRIALITSRLHAQIGKAPFDYITSMAEAHKTVRTFNRAGRAIAGILAGVKHKTLLRKRKKITAAALADVYLEARYSIRPLLYEIKGAIEAAENYGKPHRLAIHLNDKLVESTSNWVNNQNAGTYTNQIVMSMDVNDVIQSQCFAGAVLSFKTTSQGTVDVLGVDNVINSLLELTRFSFMADWLVNLFDWINSWTPEYGVTVEGTYVTLQEEAKRKVQCTSVSSSHTSSSDNEPQGGISLFKTQRDRRFGNPSKPYAPRIKIRLDGLKLLDTVAIFGGLATDFKRWKI